MCTLVAATRHALTSAPVTTTGSAKQKPDRKSFEISCASQHAWLTRCTKQDTPDACCLPTRSATKGSAAPSARHDTARRPIRTLARYRMKKMYPHLFPTRLQIAIIAGSQHRGAIAQLGERLHGMQEVGGSIPPGSTTICLSIKGRSIE